MYSPTLAALRNVGAAADVLTGKPVDASAFAGARRAGNGFVNLEYRAELG